MEQIFDGFLKEEMIRAMAMEQKKKKQMKENSYIHRPVDINLVV